MSFLYPPLLLSPKSSSFADLFSPFFLQISSKTLIDRFDPPSSPEDSASSRLGPGSYHQPPRATFRSICTNLFGFRSCLSMSGKQREEERKSRRSRVEPRLVPFVCPIALLASRKLTSRIFFSRYLPSFFPSLLGLVHPARVGRSLDPEGFSFLRLRSPSSLSAFPSKGSLVRPRYALLTTISRGPDIPALPRLHLADAIRSNGLASRRVV